MFAILATRTGDYFRRESDGRLVTFPTRDQAWRVIDTWGGGSYLVVSSTFVPLYGSDILCAD